MLTKPCIFLFIPVTYPKMEYNESKNKAVTNNKNIFFKLISPKFIYQLQALTKIL